MRGKSRETSTRRRRRDLAPFSLKLKRYAKQCVYGKDKALTPEELEEAIENELVKRFGPDARVNLDPPRAGRSALVLDGGAVRVLFAAGPALEVILFRLLAQYKAVLACRVTPKQKAQFVKLVQTHIKPKPVTLSDWRRRERREHDHAGPGWGRDLRLEGRQGSERR